MRRGHSEPSKLPIDKIHVLDDVKTRVELNQATVDEYRVHLENGGKFPPIDVYRDAKTFQFVVISGEHRLRAHEAAGKTEIHCRIHYWIKNVATALEFATEANAYHGLRYTTKDKRRTIELWLSHKRLWEKSNGAIAKVIGCDPKTVAAVRAELEQLGKIPSSTRRIGADGKARSMPKAKSSPPKPAPTTAAVGRVRTAFENVKALPEVAASTDVEVADAIASIEAKIDAAEHAAVLNAPDAVELVNKAAPTPTVETVIDDQECHAEPAESDHHEDQDGDDESGVEDPIIRRKQNAIAIRQRVLHWFRDIAAEDQADAIAAARKALDEIEERVGAEVVA